MLSGTVSRPDFSRRCRRKVIEDRSRMVGTATGRKTFLVRVLGVVAKALLKLCCRGPLSFGLPNILSQFSPRRPTEARLQYGLCLVAKHGLVSRLAESRRR